MWVDLKRTVNRWRKKKGRSRESKAGKKGPEVINLLRKKWEGKTDELHAGEPRERKPESQHSFRQKFRGAAAGVAARKHGEGRGGRDTKRRKRSKGARQGNT